MTVFTIKQNDRNPMLIGQKGLKSLKRIPKGTVIGEYFGREFLENEFDDIYGGTKEWVDINMYAQGATVEVKIPYSKLAYFTNVVESKKRDENIEMIHEFKIVVDGLNNGSNIKSMLIYMNDCRTDILTGKKGDDEKVENIKLMTVEYNGWPKIFGVTTKDIPADEELFTFYGKSYLGCVQDKERNEANMRLVRQNV